MHNSTGPIATRDGRVVCVDAPGGDVIDGCVPFNPLSPAGAVNQEMLDYILFTAQDAYQGRSESFTANLSGELLQLPGGMMGFAAGVESRKESGFDRPDAFVAAGYSSGNGRQPTAGGYDLDEVYAELLVPVLADVPFAQLLEFSVASRYSDYSNFGDTVNSKFGFKWKPIDDLLVRGNWAEGFRAPSIGELFAGVADSFPSLADPCSTTFGGGYGGLTAEQQARCTAEGVPTGGYDQGNTQIRISVGGNPNLEPESSTTKTLGLVWSPSFFQGFDVSLDWWNIELENTITSFSGQFILDQCIEEGIQPFCDTYSRFPSGNIDSLLSSGINIGAQNVEGYDLTLNYRLPEQSWGTLSFNWDTTYLASYEQDQDADGDIDELDGGSQVGEYSNQNNNWRVRSNLMTRWEMGDVGATLFTRYYSRQEETCPFYYNDYGFGELCNDSIVDANGVNQPGSQNKIGGTTYHDVSMYWKAPWNAKITLGVNNVFDKQPPEAFNSFANSFDPQYEIPGQFYYLQYNQKF